MKKFDPECKEPTLYSAGCGRWTPHTFVECRQVTLPTPADADAGPGGSCLELIYSCDETGAERRWGLVDPARLP